MHLKYRNMNDAFYGIVRGIHEGDIPTIKCGSRNGPVLQVEEPVILTYEKPLERVLFNRRRDANCLFFAYESLWMLAGRNDVAPLAYYNKRMTEYSDDGQTLNGAYGYRWRHALAPMWVGDDLGYPPGSHEARPIIDEPRRTIVDQLDLLVNHLRANSSSRRAVLSIWNVGDDLLNAGTSRDVACNLSAVFQVREGGLCKECMFRNQTRYFTDPGPCPVCGSLLLQVGKAPGCLDMTVFNRSNDLIWGTLGANAVHFSFLLEYVAARLELAVGKYHQVTANLHAYEANWHPDEWLKEECYDDNVGDYGASPYREGRMKLVPLVKDPARFEQEIGAFVEVNKGPQDRPRIQDIVEGRYVDWQEPFLRGVAQPLCNAWYYYKKSDLTKSLRWADLVEADDWRLAAVQWLTARKERREKEVSGGN